MWIEKISLCMNQMFMTSNYLYIHYLTSIWLGLLILASSFSPIIHAYTCIVIHKSMWIEKKIVNQMFMTSNYLYIHYLTSIWLGAAHINKFILTNNTCIYMYCIHKSMWIEKTSLWIKCLWPQTACTYTISRVYIGISHLWLLHKSMWIDSLWIRCLWPQTTCTCTISRVYIGISHLWLLHKSMWIEKNSLWIKCLWPQTTCTYTISRVYIGISHLWLLHKSMWIEKNSLWIKGLWPQTTCTYTISPQFG